MYNILTAIDSLLYVGYKDEPFSNILLEYCIGRIVCTYLLLNCLKVMGLLFHASLFYVRLALFSYTGWVL